MKSKDVFEPHAVQTWQVTLLGFLMSPDTRAVVCRDLACRAQLSLDIQGFGGPNMQR